jgi:hypothetical protein
MFLYIWTGTIIGLAEGWNFGQSAYWAAMTVTTIGYGDFSPTTPSGRGFCVIYCPLAVLVLARTGLQIKNVLQEAKFSQISLQKIRAMDKDADGKVHKAEYIAAVLVSMGQASEATIELLELQFKYLDSKQRGKCLPSVLSHRVFSALLLLFLQLTYMLAARFRVGFLDEDDICRIEQLKLKSINDVMDLDKLLADHEEAQRNGTAPDATLDQANRVVASNDNVNKVIL